MHENMKQLTGICPALRAKGLHTEHGKCVHIEACEFVALKWTTQGIWNTYAAKTKIALRDGQEALSVLVFGKWKLTNRHRVRRHKSGRTNVMSNFEWLPGIRDVELLHLLFQCMHHSFRQNARVESTERTKTTTRITTRPWEWTIPRDIWMDLMQGCLRESSKGWVLSRWSQ